MKYKKAKITVFLFTAAMLIVSVCLDFHHADWLFPRHEIVTYVLMMLSSVFIFHEAETFFSEKVHKGLLALGNAVFITCVICLFNNMLRYLEEYSLFHDIMEWGFLDVVLRDISYSTGLGIFRYVICFFMVLCLSIFLMTFNREKAVCQ